MMAMVTHTARPPARPIPRSFARPASHAIARREARSMRQPVNVTVFIPLTLILVLGAPLVLFLLPLVNAVIIARGADPRIVSAALGALPALRGLDVDVQSAEANVRVKFF